LPPRVVPSCSPAMRPSSMARNCSRSTSPERPRCSAPLPNHSDGANPPSA
jgi:hypothetical protein